VINLNTSAMVILVFLSCCLVMMMLMEMLLQVLAARLMQAIVPSVETIKDSDAAEELVGELFKALGATLTTCQNDPTLTYSGTYFMCVMFNNYCNVTRRHTHRHTRTPF